MTMLDISASFEVEEADGSSRPLRVADISVEEATARLEEISARLPVAHVDGGLPVHVVNQGEGIDVSALATETSLETVLALLDAIGAAQATEATLAALSAKVPALIAGRLPVDAALDMSTLATEATLAALNAKFPAGLASGNAIRVIGEAGQALGRESTLSAIRDRFAAAALLSDALANPTTTLVGALGLVWSGTGWDRLRGDSAGGVRVQTRPDVVDTNTLGANGATHVVAVPPGMHAVTFVVGGGSMSVNGQFSIDGGVTWSSAAVSNGSQFGSPVTSTLGNSLAFTGTVPPGTTHVRTLVSAYTSGVANSRIVLSEQPGAQQVYVNGGSNVGITLGASTAIGGGINKGRVWQDDTATPLAAAGVFTGASRDVTAQGANSSAAGTQTQQGSDRSRFLAVSDVAGTLAIEVSRDNATWRRIWEEPTSNAGTGGLHVAEVEVRPATRYIRAVYVNGAAAQAHFMLQSMFLS